MQMIHCYLIRMIFYFAITTRENVRENWATLVFQSFFTELRLVISIILKQHQAHKHNFLPQHFLSEKSFSIKIFVH